MQIVTIHNKFWVLIGLLYKETQISEKIQKTDFQTVDDSLKIPKGNPWHTKIFNAFQCYMSKTNLIWLLYVNKNRFCISS